MQMFETLMLRLTTNVTVSPASSRRSSSAAQRISSITSGPLLGEQRRQLLGASARSPSRARATARGATSSATDDLRPATRAAARDERPVARLDHVEHRLRDPLRVDVLRVHAQPLGQREPVGVQALADLRRRRERVLGRDVVAVRAQPAEVGGAGARPARPTSPTGSAAPGCRRPASAAAPRRSAASCPRS